MILAKTVSCFYALGYVNNGFMPNVDLFSHLEMCFLDSLCLKNLTQHNRNLGNKVLVSDQNSLTYKYIKYIFYCKKRVCVSVCVKERQTNKEDFRVTEKWSVSSVDGI